MSFVAYTDVSLIRPIVLDTYSKECQHLPAAQQRIWFDTQAAQFDVKPLVIRKIVSEYLEEFQAQVSKKTKTSAQQVATTIGATMTKAIEVLNRGMGATKLISVEMGKDEVSGKPVFQEKREPDWGERRQAAKLILEIHGGFAPQQIDVVHKHEDLDTLTDKELNARIATGIIAFTEAKDAMERRAEAPLLPSPEEELV